MICTDIAVDGMLTGPSDTSLSTTAGMHSLTLEIIASGGVSGMKDISELEKTGVDAVIFGKAFYEGRMNGN